GRMPTREQAGVYVAVTHYLKSAERIKGDDAGMINAEMRRLPVDRFGTPARMQDNGRVVYDLGIYRVKAPAESREPWDYYAPIATVPADTAFRPASAAGCGTLAKAQ